MVMVDYCLGLILKVVCMEIRSTQNPPCSSCLIHLGKWGQYQG